MANLWLEGFEITRDADDLQRRYTVSGSLFPAFQTGRQFGYCVASGSDMTKFATPSLGNKATLIVGMAIYASDMSASGEEDLILLSFNDGSTAQTYIEFDHDNTANTFNLMVKNGDGTLLASTTDDFAYYTWYYLEVKVTINNSTGVVELRVNENEKINITSQDTQNTANAYANRVVFNCTNPTGVSDNQIDDIYINDDSGTDNNTFLGDTIVEGLLPDSDDGAQQWSATPGAGDNADEVDDAGAADDNSTYVASDLDNQQDLYVMPNLTHITGNIKSVMVQAIARLTLSGSRNMTFTYKTGAGTAQGSSVTVNDTSFDYYNEIKERDPNDSALWTVTKINALSLGQKSVA